MIDTQTPDALTPRPGHVAVRLRLFQSAGAELRGVITPPWPAWMERLYALEEHQDPDMHVGAAAITPSAAVSALSERLRSRLVLLSWTLGVLQELGWEIAADGDSLIVSCAATADEARASLERAGVAGAMCRVCDIDDEGWPMLWWTAGDADAAG
jgi:hypothetical protein